MLDYEFVARLPFIKATWLMAPELIPACAVRRGESDMMRYPGIKEDVYTAGFKPDPGFRSQFGLTEHDLVVTLRPPASEAHYHNPESELLLQAVIKKLAADPAVTVIVVPRNGRQANAIRSGWPDLLQSGKMMIPVKAVDGLNLIWHSDLVISGGGTMNREAAALGVPVYSIFRGPIGAIDTHLAQEERLVLLETVEDVHRKLKVQWRKRSLDGVPAAQPALQAVVENILAALDCGTPNPVRSGSRKLVVGSAQ
jgi:predicted glycosyltransferase